MQDYDSTLKQLLQDPHGLAAQYLTGRRLVSWRNPEMPATLTLRADSVGKDDTGETVHIEWQGRNDPKMAVRMLHYASWLLNDEGRFPLQYVFYVGAAEMSMPTTVVSEGRIAYSYNLLNIGDLDAEPLLASPDVRDNILAVLMRLDNREQALHRILGRIGDLRDANRREAFQQLRRLAGLRHMGELVEEEGKRMFVLEDYLEHDTFGPILARNLEKERQEGRMEGRNEGKRDGALQVVRTILANRFGEIPESVHQQLAGLSLPELESVSVRAFAANKPEDLLN